MVEKKAVLYLLICALSNAFLCVQDTKYKQKVRYKNFLQEVGRSWISEVQNRDFPPVQTGPGARPASCTMGTRSFAGVNCGRGELLTTHPLLVPWSW
jgi:hypothetical protein